jgi:hypothetical protein
MLETVQIIQEQGQAKFAVIEFQEYLQIKELLSNAEKLQDYLDYLHIQKVKHQQSKRSMKTLAEVKQELNLT